MQPGDNVPLSEDLDDAEDGVGVRRDQAQRVRLGVAHVARRNRDQRLPKLLPVQLRGYRGKARSWA